jgi:hypothetical protein
MCRGSFDAWQSARERDAAWCARVDAALPPFQRTRLRDPAEAEFLRSIGTPEELIGPVGTPEEVDAERADLLAFARRLRARQVSSR